VRSFAIGHYHGTDAVLSHEAFVVVDKPSLFKTMYVCWTLFFHKAV